MRCGAVRCQAEWRKRTFESGCRKRKCAKAGRGCQFVAAHWNGRQLAWPRCLASTRASLGAFNFALFRQRLASVVAPRSTADRRGSLAPQNSTRLLPTLPRPPKRAGWPALSRGGGDLKKGDQEHTTPISTPKCTETANRKRSKSDRKKKKKSWDGALDGCSLPITASPRCAIGSTSEGPYGSTGILKFSVDRTRLEFPRWPSVAQR